MRDTLRKLQGVKELLNMLKLELLKLKKDTMFFVGTIISIMVPVFLVIKDKFLSVPPNEIMEWTMSCFAAILLILSVFSGFIITNLVQKEYQSGTIKNILSSAVSRVAFICSKLLVWFLWFAITLIFIVIITILGAKLIYPHQFNLNYIKLIIAIFSKLGLLSFVSFIPLLWITILQRKLFYPSILLAIGLTGILLGGINISSDFLLPASFVPWTAVPLVAVHQLKSPYFGIGLASILITGTLGLILSCYSFYIQDQ